MIRVKKNHLYFNIITKSLLWSTDWGSLLLRCALLAFYERVCQYLVGDAPLHFQTHKHVLVPRAVPSQESFSVLTVDLFQCLVVVLEFC